MEQLRFRVKPYALEDTLRALSQPQKGFHKEIYVTKEDGELTIILEKHVSIKNNGVWVTSD